MLADMLPQVLISVEKKNTSVTIKQNKGRKEKEPISCDRKIPTSPESETVCILR